MNIQMTDTARRLISNLGLEKYTSNARISFFYKSVPQSFLVIYDSINKNRIITKQIIRNYSNIGIFRDGENLLDFSPPIDLTRFNGNTNGIFVTYDIAPDIRISANTPYNEDININLSKLKVFRL